MKNSQFMAIDMPLGSKGNVTVISMLNIVVLPVRHRWGLPLAFINQITTEIKLLAERK